MEVGRKVRVEEEEGAEKVRRGVDGVVGRLRRVGMEGEGKVVGEEAKVVGENGKYEPSDSATSTVYEGWNSLVSTLSKNIGDLTVGASELVTKGVENAQAAGEAAPVNSAATQEFFAGVFKNVSDSFQSIDTESVQKNMNLVGQQASDAFTSALHSMNVDEKSLQEGTQYFISNAQELAQQVPTVVFTQGEEETLVWQKEEVAPWDDLPEDEMKNAAILREEMGKIVVDSIYSQPRRKELFLSDLAEKDNFHFDFVKDGRLAIGALNADDNLKKLRKTLVPTFLVEDTFWDTYFFHFDRLRRELRAGLKPTTSAAPTKPSEEKEVAEATDVPTSTSKRNWDEEIDKIFDD